MRQAAKVRIFALLRRALLYPSRVCLARRAFALLVPPLCTSRIASARRAFALLVALLLCSSRVCFARPSALCVAHWLCASRIGSACRALAVRVAPLQCVSRFCSARRAFVLRGASRICVARVARLCCAPRFGLARLIAHLRLGLDTRNPSENRLVANRPLLAKIAKGPAIHRRHAHPSAADDPVGYCRFVLCT